MHSECLNEQPLSSLLIATKDGVTNYAYCTWMAGHGDGCTHVTAIFFGWNNKTIQSNKLSLMEVLVDL